MITTFKPHDVHIVIPIKNEHMAVVKFIAKFIYVVEECPDIMVTMIDDSDEYEKTMTHVEKFGTSYNIRFIRGNGNYGDSLITGMIRAGNYNKLIVMDIDHPLSKVKQMTDMLDEFDVVIGADDHQGIARKFTGFLCNKYAGLNLKHPTCGFIGFNADVTAKAGIKNIWFWLAKSKRDIIHVEWMLACRKKNLKVGELRFNTRRSTVTHHYTWKRCLKWLWDFTGMLINNDKRIYP